MKMTNTNILFQVAQNLLDNNPLLSQESAISEWRFLDSAGYHDGVTSLCIINDVSFWKTGVPNEQQQIVLIEYKSINHTGLAHSCIEEMIEVEEIVSDIRFLFEVDKDYVSGDEIEYKMQKIVAKEDLKDYGFTHEEIDFDEDEGDY